MCKILRYLFFLPCFLIGTALTLPAQERIEAFPSLEWYKVFAGNNRFEVTKDMEQAPDGSIYYAGTYTSLLYIGVAYHIDSLFADTVVSDPIDSHGYVVKLDSNGAFEWAWIITGQYESQSVVTDIVLDAKGEAWVTGWYSGDVSIPYGGNLTAPGTNGFVLHLNEYGEGSKFMRLSGNGIVPQKLFIDPQGNLQLILRGQSFPIYIGNDTLAIDTTANPFLTIIKLDTVGNVINFRYVETINSSQAGYCESTMDQNGNIYLVLWVVGNPISTPGRIVCGSDTLTLYDRNLVKIDPNLQIKWTRELRHISNINNIKIDASIAGEIYLAADASDSVKAFINRFDSSGQLLWELPSTGYRVTTGGIALSKDFLYWSGYYQCDMSIDTIHFLIGDQQPWPSAARTGYLCVVNRHTGKVAWVMSDATTNQDKRFGAIVAAEDEYITVETRVITTLCTIDTLSLQVTSADVPYNMLLRFDGKQFPVWPVVPDPIPSFSLWPNPTQGAFTVQVDQSWGPQTRLEVYNLAGQKLWAQSIQAQEVFLEMENLSGQLLLIRIVDDGSGRRMTKKLVVLH